MKPSKSYFKLIDAAWNLFKQFGVKRVSVENICKEAEVSKMTFYRNFKNKEELITHAMRLLYQENFAKYKELMAQDISFPEKIKQLVALKHENSKRFGPDIIGDILSSTNSMIVEELQREQMITLQEFRQDLKRAQEDGWIKPQHSIDFIMYYLETIQQKIIDQRMFSMFDNTEEMIDTLTDLFFYGIINKER